MLDCSHRLGKMLEKLGLPPKPSNRGAAWVVDASHCQGCSSQFTFINRKHHCRRCGGLFCGSCTQQRMVLRGQGDSPVRICDPCKKLEDAARFELRYGHKNRAAKGNIKQTSKHEDEILSQILGTDGKQRVLSGHESYSDVSPNNIQKSSSSASSSSLYEESAVPARDIGILKSLSVGTHGDILDDIGSTSPEELRQQAVEQKKKYRILKGEGKSEEALQAFKYSKELERQAGALELALRKSRRMASKAVNASDVADTQKTDDSEEPNSKKLPSQRVKERKDDLASELRELGWSDADLHDAENKPAKPMTLEGELSNLLGEMPKKSSTVKGTGGVDKTQVIALKKKALMLKREGKLAEAKEELKRAKILEKQLEEQELLGEAEDSDDELSALIRSMDGDEQAELLLDHAPDRGFNFDHLLGAKDDFAIDGNFEVTDDDMNNPELAAALKAFGWIDEEDEQGEVLALKREAISQKRAGNVDEAMSLLKKAKLLEKNLENRQSDAQISTPNIMQKSSTPHLSSEPSVVKTADEENAVKMPPKSKLMIQRELLNLKKKALALRREGHVEEAEEELRKGKVLELQLEEMDNAPKIPATRAGKKVLEPTHVDERDHGISDLKDEVEAEVTEQDMHDPALLSVLKNWGWEDDGNTESRKATRNKAEIQKELLGVKRKALALRRQGKTQEAEEELERAKDLENEIADIENANSIAMESHGLGSLIPQKTDSSVIISRVPKDEEVLTPVVPDISSKRSNMTSPPPSSSISVYETDAFEQGLFGKSGKPSEESAKNTVSILHQSLQSSDMVDSLSGSDTGTEQNSVTTASQSETLELNFTHDFDAQKAEILALKRKALTLKREGKLAEAREVLRQAKLLEKSSEGSQQAVVVPENASASTSQVPKPLSGRDRFKLQQESLSHKRNALKLRREGKIAESEAEFELAKALESQLEELGAQGSSTNVSIGKGEAMDDASVEDLLDPQLMSALTSIGWGGDDFATQPSTKSEPTTSLDDGVEPRLEKDQLEEQIKAEKLRALNFKRAGKQAEALEALRAAKRLQKQLGLLAS